MMRKVDRDRERDDRGFGFRDRDRGGFRDRDRDRGEQRAVIATVTGAPPRDGRRRNAFGTAPHEE